MIKVEARNQSIYTGEKAALSKFGTKEWRDKFGVNSVMIVVGESSRKQRTVCTKQSPTSAVSLPFFFLYTRSVNNYLEERGMTVIEKRVPWYLQARSQLSVTYVRSWLAGWAYGTCTLGHRVQDWESRQRGNGMQISVVSHLQFRERNEFSLLHSYISIDQQHRHHGNQPAKPHFHHIPVDNLWITHDRRPSSSIPP